MKKYLLIFAMLLGAVSSWGHVAENSRPVNISTIGLSPETASDMVQWALLGSSDSVKVYRAYIMCSGQLKIAIKVENTGSHKVRINWNSGFTISGQFKAISLPFTLEAEAHQTLTGNCQESVLIINPYLYVSTVQDGVCFYTIQNLNIQIL